MLATYGFYSSGHGDRLVDPSRYPNEITEYLIAEEDLLTSLASRFETLVEVGCMDGRYLDWAVRQQKSYLGIDIIERYVENGQDRILSYGLSFDRYQIKIGDAAMIHELPCKEGLLQDSAKVLAVFPFNSFGNMSEPAVVLSSLVKAHYPFLICSYLTNDFANHARSQYYQNCGYKQIKCISDNTGVRFVSSDGLDTVAYNSSYFCGVLEEHFIVEMIEFSSIGIAYKGSQRKT
ncbi:MAG: hypothetical protein WC536_04315 [Patescibacteria group bacterium]